MILDSKIVDSAIVDVTAPFKKVQVPAQPFIYPGKRVTNNCNQCLFLQMDKYYNCNRSNTQSTNPVISPAHL